MLSLPVTFVNWDYISSFFDYDNCQCFVMLVSWCLYSWTLFLQLGNFAASRGKFKQELEANSWFLVDLCNQRLTSDSFFILRYPQIKLIFEKMLFLHMYNKIWAINTSVRNISLQPIFSVRCVYSSSKNHRKAGGTRPLSSLAGSWDLLWRHCTLSSS